MRRVAHFLQNPDLFGSPFNTAFIAACRSLDYQVDLFSTWQHDHDQFGIADKEPGVRLKSVVYSPRWIVRNLFSPRWRQYAAFSGTTEDPLAAAGLLSRLWRRPLITLADEIRSGSYAGNRSRRWKDSCRWGMRKSSLTVVNETERIALQREYAGLSADMPILVYPNCFHTPPAVGDRSVLRAARNLPEQALVLCYSGMMSYANGGLWLVTALRQCSDLWVWGQITNLDPLTRGLLQNLNGSERLVLEAQRLSWQQSWSSMAAADIGMVVYLQDAPQYQHMGISSNRLCMFLAMGVPVIASRQPSFQFIEHYNCGVLVDKPAEIPAASERIAAQLDVMRVNALECAQEYIRAPERWMMLRNALAQILPP